jgi:hypothetical protein
MRTWIAVVLFTPVVVIWGTAMAEPEELEPIPEQTQAAESPAAEAPAADEDGEPVECCDDWEDIQAKDGQHVVVVGMYETVHLYKRPKPEGLTDEEYRAQLDEKFGVPTTVSVTPESGYSLMLGVYYRSEGARPAEEREQYDGKRVRVTGILHQQTPTQMHDGMPMQTMIGPYLDVKSIEPAE